MIVDLGGEKINAFAATNVRFDIGPPVRTCGAGKSPNALKQATATTQLTPRGECRAVCGALQGFGCYTLNLGTTESFTGNWKVKPIVA